MMVLCPPKTASIGDNNLRSRSASDVTERRSARGDDGSLSATESIGASTSETFGTDANGFGIPAI